MLCIARAESKFEICMKAAPRRQRNMTERLELDGIEIKKDPAGSGVFVLSDDIDGDTRLITLAELREMVQTDVPVEVR